MDIKHTNYVLCKNKFLIFFNRDFEKKKNLYKIKLENVVSFLFLQTYYLELWSNLLKLWEELLAHL